MRLRALCLIVPLVLLACGDDDDGSGAAEATTTTAAPDDEATTTTAAPPDDATTTTSPAGCEPVEPLEDPNEVTIVAGDVDADAEEDHVTTHLAEDGWHLTVELANGGGGDLVIADATTPANVHAIGVVDIDADGRGEIWAVVDAGAAALVYGLFAVPECEPVAITLDGADAQFAVGGSVGATAGVRCEDDALLRLEASSPDGETYTTRTVTHTIEGTTLVVAGEETGEIPATDPTFASFTSFLCGDLTG